MTDLVDRLRDHAEIEDIDHNITDDCLEAAREIEELRGVILRLRQEAQEAYENGQNSMLNSPGL